MTFETIKEQLQEFLTAHLDAMNSTNDFYDRRTIFDQAFGAVMFSAINLSQNHKQAQELSALWDNDWRKEFEKILYKTP